MVDCPTVALTASKAALPGAHNPQPDVRGLIITTTIIIIIIIITAILTIITTLILLLLPVV